jgi:hypothetical protein
MNKTINKILDDNYPDSKFWQDFVQFGCAVSVKTNKKGNK